MMSHHSVFELNLSTNIRVWREFSCNVRNWRPGNSSSFPASYRFIMAGQARTQLSDPQDRRLLYRMKISVYRSAHYILNYCNSNCRLEKSFAGEVFPLNEEET